MRLNRGNVVKRCAHRVTRAQPPIPARNPSRRALFARLPAYPPQNRRGAAKPRFQRKLDFIMRVETHQNPRLVSTPKLNQKSIKIKSQL